jgi:hypothetical protein
VSWWTSRSRKAQIWTLIGVGLVLVIAAGLAYLQPNRLAFSGKQAVGEVVASEQGTPSTMTVRFTTDDGEVVEATTSRLYALPPEGAAVVIRYDPDDPTEVADDLYRASSPLATALVGAFAVTIGYAMVIWRRGREERRKRPTR